MTILRSDQPIVGQQSTSISSSKPNQSVTKIVPFHSFKMTFSNFFPCEFKIGDQKYHSTEQDLYSEKAKMMSDEAAFTKIMASRTALDAKVIGKAIPWIMPAAGYWVDFASKNLYFGNWKKYESNGILRSELFDTWPKDLVECNPKDTCWGIGLNINDPAIWDEKKWQGENLFGKLLTKLRNAMMDSDDYAAEAKTIRQRHKDQDGTQQKRSRESTDDDNGDETGNDQQQPNTNSNVRKRTS